jgi:hypothetical protein
MSQAQTLKRAAWIAPPNVSQPLAAVVLLPYMLRDDSQRCGAFDRTFGKTRNRFRWNGRRVRQSRTRDIQHCVLLPAMLTDSAAMELGKSLAPVIKGQGSGKGESFENLNDGVHTLYH